MKALWGRAACTMTDMAMVLSEGGGAGDLCSMPIMQLQMLWSMHEIYHRCLLLSCCGMCCRAHPGRGDGWGPRGRMQSDLRPPFMGHRGEFQSMPHSGASLTLNMVAMTTGCTHRRK